jgi:putative photosynthetic complex assembly protein 2
MDWVAPLLFVVLAWFGATGAVLWLDRQPADRWAPSLLAATALSGFAFGVVLITAEMPGALAGYAAFAAALLLWAWHEMSFLMGFVTGPRRIDLPAGARGWRRFRFATATLIHHEIAIALTAVALLLATWGQPNALAAHAFLLLFLLRLSAKMNIFLGVPHFVDDMLPGHLAYLRSYFRKAPASPLFPASVVGIGVLAAVLAVLAANSPAGSGDQVRLLLLAALTALGLLEHLFLVLPVRDSILWRWAMPANEKIMKGNAHGL